MLIECNYAVLSDTHKIIDDAPPEWVRCAFLMRDVNGVFEDSEGINNRSNIQFKGGEWLTIDLPYNTILKKFKERNGNI